MKPVNIILIIISWNLFSSPSWSIIDAGIIFSMNHQTQYLVSENKVYIS